MAKKTVQSINALVTSAKQGQLLKCDLSAAFKIIKNQHKQLQSMQKNEIQLANRALEGKISSLQLSLGTEMSESTIAQKLSQYYEDWIYPILTRNTRAQIDLRRLIARPRIKLKNQITNKFKMTTSDFKPSPSLDDDQVRMMSSAQSKGQIIDTSPQPREAPNFSKPQDFKHVQEFSLGNQEQQETKISVGRQPEQEKSNPSQLNIHIGGYGIDQISEAQPSINFDLSESISPSNKRDLMFSPVQTNIDEFQEKKQDPAFVQTVVIKQLPSNNQNQFYQEPELMGDNDDDDARSKKQQFISKKPQNLPPHQNQQDDEDDEDDDEDDDDQDFYHQTVSNDASYDDSIRKSIQIGADQMRSRQDIQSVFGLMNLSQKLVYAAVWRIRKQMLMPRKKINSNNSNNKKSTTNKKINKQKTSKKKQNYDNDDDDNHAQEQRKNMKRPSFFNDTMSQVSVSTSIVDYKNQMELQYQRKNLQFLAQLHPQLSQKKLDSYIGGNLNTNSSNYLSTEEDVAAMRDLPPLPPTKSHSKKGLGQQKSKSNLKQQRNQQILVEEQYSQQNISSTPSTSSKAKKRGGNSSRNKMIVDPRRVKQALASSQFIKNRIQEVQSESTLSRQSTHKTLQMGGPSGKVGQNQRPIYSGEIIQQQESKQMLGSNFGDFSEMDNSFRRGQDVISQFNNSPDFSKIKIQEDFGDDGVEGRGGATQSLFGQNIQVLDPPTQSEQGSEIVEQFISKTFLSEKDHEMLQYIDKEIGGYK